MQNLQKYPKFNKKRQTTLTKQVKNKQKLAHAARPLRSSFSISGTLVVNYFLWFNMFMCHNFLPVIVGQSMAFLRELLLSCYKTFVVKSTENFF